MFYRPNSHRKLRQPIANKLESPNIFLLKFIRLTQHMIFTKSPQKAVCALNIIQSPHEGFIVFHR